MKYFLASDLDGTLFHPRMVNGVKQFVISEEDCAAISEFRRRGHYFSLCTGRTPRSISRVLENWPLLEADGLILASGGCLYTVDRRDPLAIGELETHYIPAEAAADFIKYFHKTEKFTVYWTTFRTSYGLIDRSPAHEKAHRLELISLEDWPPEPVISLGLTPLSSSAEDALEALAAIARLWPRHMSAFRNTIYIDVSARGVDKGRGLARMVELAGGDYLPCAVGDAHNDIPMFREAGKARSFLLASGEQDLLPMVNHAVGSVAHCIEYLLSKDLP